MTHHETIYGFSHIIHEASERIINSDIFHNQSSLVNIALSNGTFSHDDIYNLYSLDNGYHEIYEWWAISEWLADELRDIHEPILSNEYGIWWGRTCTGQAIILDGTIQQIVERIDRQLD